MKRRDFVLSTAAAAGLFPAPLITGCAREGEVSGGAGRARLPSIGLQLYTVRGLMEHDFEGTISSVADIGYDEVEFAGYFGHAPADVRAILERVGLRAPSAHVPIEAFRADRAQAIADGLAVGHEYLIVPWIAEDERTLDGYRRKAQEFNEIGRACQEQGVRFGYHNHDFEFTLVEGRLPYDILLDETDPADVHFEMDLYWIRKGGQDALRYFERYPSRFELCHVKDMNQSEGMVPVGDGLIDFGAIFSHSQQAGLRHYFVEHDNPDDPIQSITKSYAFLDALRF